MVEMQLDRPDAELTEYPFDALFDGGVVGAVASDKFFDNRAYRSGCQQPMGNKHRPTSLDHLGFCFPFADCPCFSAFCFLFLSFSFLPPLSPILGSSPVEIVSRACPLSAIIAPWLWHVESKCDLARERSAAATCGPHRSSCTTSLQFLK